MTGSDLLSASSLAWAALALGAICAALLLAPRLLRAAGLDPAARPGRRLAVIEVAAIDPRRRLVLARCDRAEVLLLVGGGADSVVGWLPPSPPPAALPPAPLPPGVPPAPPRPPAASRQAVIDQDLA